MNEMTLVNGEEAYGWVCDIFCGTACALIPFGCALICTIDGPFPALDASATVVSVVTGGAGSAVVNNIVSG